MSKKKKHSGHEEEGEAWLLPYSDLMTLLLAVFIVLFAVSQVDAAKAKLMSDEFSDKMMSQEAAMSNNPNNEVPEEKTSVVSESASAKANFSEEVEQENLQKLKAQLDTLLDSKGLTGAVTTIIDERGLVVRFNNAILFDSGSAEIIKEKEGILLDVAKLIKTMQNYIRIEGHTDTVPMSSEVYPSNWELSSARASSVVKLFINKSQISPDRLVAVGYGEYKPVADNKTPEGRQKNRRIDIIVMSEKYNNLEKHMDQKSPASSKNP